MLNASYNLNTARMIVYLIVSILLGLLAYGVFGVVEHFLRPHARSPK